MTAIQGTALVTGASGGIGQAIARALAARGVQVLLSGRRADVLEPLAQELGGRAIAADLADRDAAERLAAEAGEVEILVANAALPASGTMDDYTLEQIDRAIEVNLRAPIALAKLLSKGMAARGHGHVVFISSTAGKVAAGGGALYSATKFGVRGFALALREDLAPAGVGVSTIYPGFIRDAGMFARSGVRLPPGVGTRTPADVAAGVVRAIERNKAEIDVAPLSMRAGTALAGITPADLGAALRQRMGAARIAAGLTDAQRSSR